MGNPVSRQSQEWDRLITYVNDIVSQVNIQGCYQYISPSIKDILGYVPQDLIGNMYFDLIHTDDLTKVQHQIKLLINNGLPIRSEYRHRHAEGHFIWLESTANLFFDDQGVPIGIVICSRDITERKNLEEKLQESETQYKLLIEQAVDGIFEMNLKGFFLHINRSVCDMLGYSREEILKMRICDLLLPGDVLEMDSELDKILAGKAGMKAWQFKRKNGKILDVEVSVKRLPGERIQGIIRDITVRKKMEEEILKASKLESLGVLAGGISHDFNNILTAILGNITLVKMKIDREGKQEVIERLKKVEKAIFQAKDLTQKMITFAKGRQPIKKTESIKDLIKDEVLFFLSGSNIKCECNVPDDLMPAEMDWGQISEVINNLVVNAMQAMPEGGKIEVSAENITIGVEERSPLPPGDYIHISVRDCGAGIVPEHLDKIFDPYFTTKEKGNGLGLSICYSIVQQHGGILSVESEVGYGTIFHIYLPAVNRTCIPNDEKQAKVFEGKGKIRVMGDEMAIKEVAEEMLSHE